MFLDIGMPDMDGLAVARAIRAMTPSAPVALVAVTGWGREGDREAAFRAGFDHHITKPPDWTSLAQAISAVLPAGARRNASAARTPLPSAE
jgi:CheY-like chemotaxis protein